MPLDASVVGRDVGRIVTPITMRRAMAFAAGIGDHNMRYYDNTRPEPVVAQPIIGVSLDYPLREVLRASTGLAAEEMGRGVLFTQDLIFHRLIRVGDELTTQGIFVGAEQRSPGGFLMARYNTTDAAGQPVVTSYIGLLQRGIPYIGEAKWLDRPPEYPTVGERTMGGWSVPVWIPWGLPHIYSECSLGYTPIHTERAFAKAVGLPDIVLHGTATLAIAARELINRECAGDPGRLARITVRLGAWVIPESEITVRLDERARVAGGRLLRFTVTNAEGAPAIRDGMAIARDS